MCAMPRRKRAGAPACPARGPRAWPGLCPVPASERAAVRFRVPQEFWPQEIIRRVDALFALSDRIEQRVAAATARADRVTQAVLAKAFRGELVERDVGDAEGRC